MSLVRLALTLFLTVALDLSSPVPPHAGASPGEEFEEVVHVRGGHRAVRHVRDSVPPPVARDARVLELTQDRPLPPAPRRWTTEVLLIVKRPPSVAEASSAPTPEDH